MREVLSCSVRISGPSARTDVYKRQLLEQKNKFSVGETIEVMIPDGTNKEVIVKAIEDEDGRPMESAPHPKPVSYTHLRLK